MITKSVEFLPPQCLGYTNIMIILVFCVPSGNMSVPTTVSVPSLLTPLLLVVLGGMACFGAVSEVSGHGRLALLLLGNCRIS